MQTPKNYVILLLTLTTIAGAVLAWREYQDLTELRASLLTKDERADWQKRLWAAEKNRTDLEKEIATLKQPAPAAEEPASAESAAPERTREPRRGGRANFMAMMEQPEMQRLVAVQQKAALDARYSALFKSLNLTPEQLDKFKNLLVEKRTAMMDVMAAAREQGINPRTDRAAFDKLVSDAQAEVDASIRSTVGDAGFNQYQDFEKTVPQRNVVNQLEQRLSYSSTPLTSAQSEQMVAILAATATARGGNRAIPAPLTNAGAGMFGAFPGGTPQITDATINQSLGVLAGPQVDALRQLQQEQQAQAALSAAMRDQFRNRGNSTPAPAPATTPAPSSSTAAPKTGGG